MCKEYLTNYKPGKARFVLSQEVAQPNTNDDIYHSRNNKGEGKHPLQVIYLSVSNAKILD
jgi:hypothetical protein